MINNCRFVDLLIENSQQVTILSQQVISVFALAFSICLTCSAQLYEAISGFFVLTLRDTTLTAVSSQELAIFH